MSICKAEPYGLLSTLLKHTKQLTVKLTIHLMCDILNAVLHKLTEGKTAQLYRKQMQKYEIINQWAEILRKQATPEKQNVK